MECTISEECGIKWLNITGRIDGMTCGEIRRNIQALINGGHRIFTANLSGVNYVSSAGLRVFLEAQKQLNPVGGSVYLYGLADNVLKIFEMSGLLTLFRIFSKKDEIEAALKTVTSTAEVETREVRGIAMEHMRKEAPRGSLRVIGSQTNLLYSKYTEKDVETLTANDMQFGFGMATLGDEYDEYKNLFGEALVMNRNLFFYPAVKHPVADFMLCQQDGANPEYRFLNGLGFSGSCHHTLSFESGDGSIDMTGLIGALFEFSSQNLLGIVLLAESKGFWGMNIKKSPIMENRPENGMDILDAVNFAEWMNFPVEPGEFNHIIACAGIAVKDPSVLEPELADLFAKGYPFHLHGAVFSKGPLGKDVRLFERELNRVLTELEISKVQHVLGQSLLGSGMAGIIELKG